MSMDDIWRYAPGCRLGPTASCRVGQHFRCSHRRGGPAENGIQVPECAVTMPPPCPGLTGNQRWVPRFPNGVDVAVVEPHHIYRCPCDCHATGSDDGQLGLFEVVS
jgi:hypothetical protein